MSEKKSINLIVIAVIATAIIAFQFTLFLSYGLTLEVEIAAENINVGTLLFFISALISLITMAIALLLVAVEMLLETDKIDVVKISSILILIAVILLVIQVLVGTMDFLGLA